MTPLSKGPFFEPLKVQPVIDLNLSSSDVSSTDSSGDDVEELYPSNVPTYRRFQELLEREIRNGTKDLTEYFQECECDDIMLRPGSQFGLVVVQFISSGKSINSEIKVFSFEQIAQWFKMTTREVFLMGSDHFYLRIFSMLFGKLARMTPSKFQLPQEVIELAYNYTPATELTELTETRWKRMEEMKKDDEKIKELMTRNSNCLASKEYHFIQESKCAITPIKLLNVEKSFGRKKVPYLWSPDHFYNVVIVHQEESDDLLKLVESVNESSGSIK